MGMDFICGCRLSSGHWFLCSDHEKMILNDTWECNLDNCYKCTKEQQEQCKMDRLLD